jgi:cob(I)alamin adenosyltransferase
MVRIDRVVTRGGDGGMTSLGDGSRLRKDAPRIEAIGAIDEANAAVGWLRAAVAPRDPNENASADSNGDANDDTDAMLARIQNDLFDAGADLCVPGEGGDRLRLTDVPVLRLETEIETLNARLPPLTSFILPGGSEAAARAHMARVIVRRAERCLIAVEGLNPALTRYLNRLSDHLFVLARVFNDDGARDVLWRPGANG